VEFYVKNKKCKSKVKKVEQGGSGCVKSVEEDVLKNLQIC
jgi:hypothetical protein